MITKSSSLNTTSGKFAHLEASISSVATQLGDYIKESKEYRDRIERDQSLIWDAIKEQGKNLQSAVDRLTIKGQISWSVILSSISVVVLVVSAGATVSHKLMESRIKQLEIQDQSMEKLHESNLEQFRIRDEMMMRIIDEDHIAIQKMKEK